jgi:hypothetical protein
MEKKTITHFHIHTGAGLGDGTTIMQVKACISKGRGDARTQQLDQMIDLLCKNLKQGILEAYSNDPATTASSSFLYRGVDMGWHPLSAEEKEAMHI